MKTLIYHITYYDYDRSIYIQFAKCNFKCVGCIRNRFSWDHHLYEEKGFRELRKLSIETLSLEEFADIVKNVEKELGLKRAVLGGGEPTIDPAFCNIVKVLSDLGLEIAILTNGYLLHKVLNCIPKGSTVELSVKSIHPKKFAFYTKRSEDDLREVLKNMKLVLQSDLKLVIETILIPDFNNAEDVELLAQYIASSLGNYIPMIIDEYVPVPTAPWRRPTYEELVEAKQRAEKHLMNVILRSSYTMKFKGKVYLIYPKAL